MKMYKISRRNKPETDGSDRDLKERSIPMPEDGENRSRELENELIEGRRNRSPEPEKGENQRVRSQ